MPAMTVVRGVAVTALVVAAANACHPSRSASTTAPSIPAPSTTAPSGSTGGAGSTTTGPLGGGPPCGRRGHPPAVYQHVIWIWMENHTWPQVLGDAGAAPYETSLARTCATATDYAAIGSPSLPNYLGATSGSSHGIGDDGGPSSHPLSDDNLFRQVRSGGGSERSYQEDMASPCQLTSNGRYAVKHNPAAYYQGESDRAACQSDDVSLSAFGNDVANDRLPTFALVTPNLCNDTHDCGVATGDAWLARILPGLLASPAYRSGTTAVFVVWDESTPTPNLFIAPSVPAATVWTQATDHFGLLGTTEEMLGLPKLGAAAAATSLRSGLHL